MYDLVRIATVGFPSSKYLDIFNFKEINSLTFIVFESEKANFKDLYIAKDFFNIDIESKIKIHYIKQNWFQKQLIRVLRKLKLNFLIYHVSGIHSGLKKYTLPHYIFWTGDNDFEVTNLYVQYIKMYFSNFLIRTYKETRYRIDLIEKEALVNSDLLVLPNKSYFSFFKKLYNLDLEDKTVIADLDWRYSGNIKYLNTLQVEKLSKKDKKIHACLLVGKLIFDKNDTRDANRYYYIDVIEKLINNGFIVHIHAKQIVQSTANPIYVKDNPYEKLTLTGKVFIEDLNLYSGSKDYEILMKYDVGILHPVIEGDEYKDVKEFQEINIPNRFYEYIMAGVMPIVESGAGYEMEQLIKETKFGIVYKNQDDLKNQILNFENMRKEVDFSFDQLLLKIIDQLRLLKIGDKTK